MHNIGLLGEWLIKINQSKHYKTHSIRYNSSVFVIESTGFGPRWGPLAPAVWASVPVPKSVRRTAARAPTGARVHSSQSPLCSESVSELLRAEGGMAAPWSFFTSLPALVLLLCFSFGYTSPGNRRGNQERCGFKVNDEFAPFLGESPPLVLALLQAVAAASPLSLKDIPIWEAV